MFIRIGAFFLLLALVDLNSGDEYDWETHKKKFSLSFSTESEDNERKEIWVKNMADINDHNKKAANDSTITYHKGPNQFTHLTYLEFIALHTGYVKRKSKIVHTKDHFVKRVVRDTELSDSVDWRNSSLVGPIKNQGTCG